MATLSPEAQGLTRDAYDEDVYDEPVPCLRRSSDPEIRARTDAFLASLTPEQLAVIEEAERLDRLDYERNR
jgi:hypothetical protein